MILLLTIPHEQESRFDTDRPYKERNEVNMIHLGDITKIHGNEIEPVTKKHFPERKAHEN